MLNKTKLAFRSFKKGSEEKKLIQMEHIFKSYNIYLKPERFRKSKFTLWKVKRSGLNIYYKV